MFVRWMNLSRFKEYVAKQRPVLQAKEWGLSSRLRCEKGRILRKQILDSQCVFLLLPKAVVVERLRSKPGRSRCRSENRTREELPLRVYKQPEKSKIKVFWLNGQECRYSTG